MFVNYLQDQAIDFYNQIVNIFMAQRARELKSELENNGKLF